MTSPIRSVWQRATPTERPFRHLIERYEHRPQLVTCTCGWQGSSAEGDVAGWKAHLSEMRAPSSVRTKR